MTARAFRSPVVTKTDLEIAIDKLHGTPGLRLQTLADEFGISERHIRRLCRQLLDQSFRAYVRGVRIRRAEQLLDLDALPVKALADELGYSSPSHFCRDFRLYKGTTPRQYKTGQ